MMFKNFKNIMTFKKHLEKFMNLKYIHDFKNVHKNVFNF